MSDAKTGDSAWKAELERINERNMKVKKAGKAEREAREHKDAVHRKEHERKIDADLNGAKK
jgi:hypothetical protein